MARFPRLTLLLLPAAAMVLALALPGRAQQADAQRSARYAFADTTLLRDTLNLHFDGIFPTADSLQLTPDTLRALMIRYRMTLPRILKLADSLSVPVDSVGPVMLRELFNPLANRGAHAKPVTDFQYTSGYDIQRSSTTWTNGSTYRMTRGPTYLNNTTNIELQRITSTGITNFRQNRTASTEAGFTPSKNFSLGGRSEQLRYFYVDPGASTTQDENKNEYSLTARLSRRNKVTQTEGNVKTGWLDDNNVTGIKKGFSGSADGRFRVQKGQSFTHDLSGSVSGNIARTRLPTEVLEKRTRDLATNLRGALTLYANSPVSLNANYGLRNSRVETPTDSGTINTILTRSNSADGTLRLRRDNDRYLNVNGGVTSSQNQNGTRVEGSGKAQLRWTLSGAALDMSFNETRAHANYPRQRSSGGYFEHSLVRSADGQLVRALGPKFVSKLLGSIALEQYRYSRLSPLATLPTTRDAYRQLYRGELNWNPSQKMTSGVVMQVSLTRGINIAALSTGANNDVRSYRGEWRWNYVALKSLTITQNNMITADYSRYPFAPASNTLALGHNTATSLSARLPSNLYVDVQHNTSRLPRGSFLRALDGFDYLQLSDESQNATLSASLRYQPWSSLGFHAEPRYQSSDRSGTVNGSQQKQRGDKRLDFSGGVDLNYRVGRTGQLTGRVSRTYTDQRTVTYSNGLGTFSPRSESDFWQGSLQLMWSL